MIYADKKQYKKSLDYFEKTLVARRVGKEKIGIISALINQSVVFNKLEKYDESTKNLGEALDLAREMNDPAQMRSCYGMLSETYEKAGNTQQSLYYYNYFKTFNNLVTEKRIKKSNEELKNERLQRELAELEKRNKELELAKTEKKLEKTEEEVNIFSEKQKELLQTLSKQEMSLKIIKQESEIKELENKQLKTEKRQQTIIIGTISILLLFIGIFSVILLRLYREKNRFNKILLNKNQEIYQQKEEIEAQRDELEKSNIIIEQKNNAITHSINYAKHIQSAMLNRKNKFLNYIPDSFILFKPRDTVSGDFYWYSKIGSKVFIIVSDCTGHGVPGGFISMTGSNLLTNIIEHSNIHDPANILIELDKGIIETLNQNSSENSDGMDISVCVIDEQAKTLEYSGAKSPLIIFQNNEMSYIAPDKSTIGGIQHARKKKKNTKKSFTTQKFDLSSSSDTAIYMYSDGIVDQFDSNNKKKFSRKQLKGVLQNIHHLPMNKQKEKIREVTENWQGNNHQTDDITIVGFKI